MLGLIKKKKHFLETSSCLVCKWHVLDLKFLTLDNFTEPTDPKVLTGTILMKFKSSESLEVQSKQQDLSLPHQY